MNILERSIAFVSKRIPPMRAPACSIRHPLLAKSVLQSWEWTGPNFQTVVTTDYLSGASHQHNFARNSNSVFKLKRCSVRSPQGLVFIEGLAIEESNYRGGGVSDAVAMMRAWANFAQASRRSSGGLGQALLSSRPKFFMTTGFDNYYHFLIETLPKLLEVMEKVPELLIVTPKDLPMFARKFLSDSGMEFLEVGPGTWHVSELFVVEREPYLPPTDYEIRLLTEKFLNTTGVNKLSQDLKLYVSRVGSSRSIKSEEEVEAHLEGQGYIVLRPENLTDLYLNAELFAKANVVIGPHGAGLANTVFCAPGTELIEFATPNWWNPAFAAIASAKNIRHRLVFLEVDNPNQSGCGKEAISILDSMLSR